MAEKDNSAIGLTGKQTEKVAEDLNKQGATFFSWEQLQIWLAKLGSKAKVSDVQKAIKAEKDKEVKQ